MGAGPTGGINQPFDVESYRARICTMTDAELIEEGKWMRLVNKQHTLPWDTTWEIKLAECKTEWRRRHPPPELRQGERF
jgi:hypothetical protein